MFLQCWFDGSKGIHPAKKPMSFIPNGSILEHVERTDCLRLADKTEVTLHVLVYTLVDMCVAGRRRMMEAPPPPPASAVAVVSAQNTDSGSVMTSVRRMSGPTDVATQPPVSIVRHVSVPCDSSTSAIVAPLSHSLPRPASKISDGDKVTCLLINLL